MSVLSVPAGANCPDEVNVIIEIPLRGEPIKYEVDKETGTLHVDRFLGTAMAYPVNYGYIPQTLSEDGDPVDVLVMAPLPLLSGSVISCHPVGLLAMEDESGIDAKILAVPVDKLSPLYKDIQKPEDFPSCILNMISHFFEHYKDLEKNKWVKLQGWHGADAAKKEITNSIARFLASEKS